MARTLITVINPIGVVEIVKDKGFEEIKDYVLDRYAAESIRMTVNEAHLCVMIMENVVLPNGKRGDVEFQIRKG